MRREKAGRSAFGIGTGAVLLFGSGLDCPENNMFIIYGGVITGLIFMVIGAKMANAWG